MLLGGVYWKCGWYKVDNNFITAMRYCMQIHKKYIPFDFALLFISLSLAMLPSLHTFIVVSVMWCAMCCSAFYQIESIAYKIAIRMDLCAVMGERDLLINHFCYSHMVFVSLAVSWRDTPCQIFFS